MTLVGLGYTLALIVGSIPAWMRKPLPDLDRATRSVRAAFYRVRGKPGLAVFHGRGKQNRVPRYMCVMVFGRDTSGELDVLHESYPNCKYPAIRWSADTFNLVLSQQVGVGRLEGLARTRGKWHRRRVAQLRSRGPLDGASRYFCTRDQPAMVYIVARTSAVYYETGKRFGRADVIHRFNCETGRRDGPPLEAKLVGGRVVVQ